MRNYLIVANQTLGGPALTAKVAELAADGNASFHVVVPATRTQEGLTWTVGAARARAARRMERALNEFHALGVRASGNVADESPVLAILDALRAGSFDEIMLCTLPAGASKWLKQDLPRRVRKHVSVALTHFVGDRERELELVAAA
jgi:hypothetical protein